MVKISEEDFMEVGKKSWFEKKFESLFGFKEVEVLEAPKKVEPEATMNFSGKALFAVSYTGEKNLGELGPIVDYRPDYDLLRLRSWQSYLESEISQIVINKFTLWVIGSGLKLKAQPNKTALATEGVIINSEAFNEQAESRWWVYSNSKLCDYKGMETLHDIAKKAEKNSIIGGDVLVVLRLQNGNVTVQLIDGAHLRQPFYSSPEIEAATIKGNIIRNGVELSPTGEHVAFYVMKPNAVMETYRIEAKGVTGITQAFLVYGLEYRLDNVRGLPLISAVLESTKKLERYKEATLGSAEERQKIAYSIEHNEISDGENPLQKQLAKAFNADINTDDLPIDVNGVHLSNTVAATTGKQAINMPRGASLKTLESKNELYFKDFYSVNIDLICAALGVPPNVAMSKYDSNFSASRAALKDWEHTLNVRGAEFANNFYKKIYDFWLEIEILKNKIQAPYFIIALNQKNEFVLSAYKACRFIGPAVPHIDPLKEVKAEREKLGSRGASIPLTTVEDATEALNGGDSDSNMEQFSEELKEAKRLEIFQEPIQQGGGGNAGTSED